MITPTETMQRHRRHRVDIHWLIESIILARDTKQFGTSSDLIIHPYWGCTESIIFFYASSFEYFMDSTELPVSIFHRRIYHED